MNVSLTNLYVLGDIVKGNCNISLPSSSGQLATCSSSQTLVGGMYSECVLASCTCNKLGTFTWPSTATAMTCVCDINAATLTNKILSGCSLSDCVVTSINGISIPVPGTVALSAASQTLSNKTFGDATECLRIIGPSASVLALPLTNCALIGNRGVNNMNGTLFASSIRLDFSIGNISIGATPLQECVIGIFGRNMRATNAVFSHCTTRAVTTGSAPSMSLEVPRDSSEAAYVTCGTAIIASNGLTIGRSPSSIAGVDVQGDVAISGHIVGSNKTYTLPVSSSGTLFTLDANVTLTNMTFVLPIVESVKQGPAQPAITLPSSAATLLLLLTGQTISNKTIGTSNDHVFGIATDPTPARGDTQPWILSVSEARALQLTVINTNDITAPATYGKLYLVNNKASLVPTTIHTPNGTGTVVQPSTSMFCICDGDYVSLCI